MNENFVCTYLKVGTFQIINGQKVGGNVASYFALSDGSVIHAIPGQVNGNKMLAESRWAYETRKAALTHATNLTTGSVDLKRYTDQIKKSHMERYHMETHGAWGGGSNKQMLTIPQSMPRNTSQQAQAHWLLAREPLVKMDRVYPIVWEQVLKEKLSTLPVAQR